MTLLEHRVRKFPKRSCARSVAPSIPMSLLGRKSCSPMGSTIFKSHFHGAKVAYPIFFWEICQAEVAIGLCISHLMKNLLFITKHKNTFNHRIKESNNICIHIYDCSNIPAKIYKFLFKIYCWRLFIFNINCKIKYIN